MMNITLRFVVIAAIAISSALAFAKDPVALIAHENFAPYWTQEEGYEQHGMIAHIVREAFKNQGIEVSHKWVPYARAVKYIKDGKVPLHLGSYAAFSPEERKYIAFEELFIGEYGFYSYEHTIDFRDFEDMKGYTIGTWIGDFPNEFLKPYQLNLTGKRNAETLVKMLEAQRLDFVTTEKLGFLTSAKKIFPEKFKGLNVTKKSYIVPGRKL